MSDPTPGPWNAGYSDGSGLECVVANNKIIADTAPGCGCCASDPNKEDFANAILMAAAPDMLEVLTWIRDNCTGLPAVARALAEKAIAKAEGRTG